MKHKRLSYGLYSAALTAAFVAGVVLVNMLATLLTDRFYLKADMTAEKIYEISGETEAVLRALPESVELYVLATEAEMETITAGGFDLPAVRETLRKYETIAAGRLRVFYLDPELNAGLLQKYKPEGGELSRYDIIAATEKRHKVLGLTELFSVTPEYDSYGLGIQVGLTVNGLQIDQAVTGALLSVTADTLPRAVFTEGHGETPQETLLALLQAGNYETETVDLARAALPEGASALIISAPMADFTGAEIALVDDYLKNGGSVLVAVDQATPGLPVLERFLAAWGMQLADRFVMDDAQAIQSPLYLIPQLAEHAVTEPFLHSSLYAVTSMSRPITSVWTGDASGDRALSPLLFTSETSYARLISADSRTTEPARRADDTPGPFVIAALCEETRYSVQGAARPARVLLLPVSLTVDYGDRFLNGSLMSGLLSYMTEAGQTVRIPAKSYADNRMTNTQRDNVFFFWALVVLLPLGILAAGYWVWHRRRHL